MFGHGTGLSVSPWSIVVLLCVFFCFSFFLFSEGLDHGRAAGAIRGSF